MWFCQMKISFTVIIFFRLLKKYIFESMCGAIILHQLRDHYLESEKILTFLLKKMLIFILNCRFYLFNFLAVLCTEVHNLQIETESTENFRFSEARKALQVLSHEVTGTPCSLVSCPHLAFTQLHSQDVPGPTYAVLPSLFSREACWPTADCTAAVCTVCSCF